MEDCRRELHELLQEEVRALPPLLSLLEMYVDAVCMSLQRLMGASLLVFANKQDIASAMTSEEISVVRAGSLPVLQCGRPVARPQTDGRMSTGSRPAGPDLVSPLVDPAMLCAVLPRLVAPLYVTLRASLKSNHLDDLHRHTIALGIAPQRRGPAHHARAGLGRRRGRVASLLRLAEPGAGPCARLGGKGMT